jgi:transposase
MWHILFSARTAARQQRLDMPPNPPSPTFSDSSWQHPRSVRRDYETAAQLLLTAGDNVERLHSEAGFAALCGVSPVLASSGKVQRHRLNRGGDRAANSALHIIAIGRLRLDDATKASVAKRLSLGNSKAEAIRCLKRYIAREVYHSLRSRKVEIGRNKSALDC